MTDKANNSTEELLSLIPRKEIDTESLSTHDRAEVKAATIILIMKEFKFMFVASNVMLGVSG